MPPLTNSSPRDHYHHPATDLCNSLAEVEGSMDGANNLPVDYTHDREECALFTAEAREDELEDARNPVKMKHAGEWSDYGRKVRE